MLFARYILALDTALNGCSAALFDCMENKCVAESKAMIRGQSEELVPMINRVIAEAGIKYENIHVVAVTVGPGAFTGLRIGLSTARSLGLALNKPVLGVTTLEVITRHYLEDHWLEEGESLAVIVDTKRNDFYVQFYDGDEYEATEPAACSAEKIMAWIKDRSMVCVGDALPRFRAEVGERKNLRYVEGYEHPDPGYVAKIAASMYGHASKGTVFPAPEPLYLRPPDVSVSKKKLRTLATES